MIRWHCPPDTGFKIRALPITLPLTVAPHYTSEHRKKTFLFFETSMPGQGTNPRSPTFPVGSFNHCTGPPPRRTRKGRMCWLLRTPAMDIFCDSDPRQWQTVAILWELPRVPESHVQNCTCFNDAHNGPTALCQRLINVFDVDSALW